MARREGKEAGRAGTRGGGKEVGKGGREGVPDGLYIRVPVK